MSRNSNNPHFRGDESALFVYPAGVPTPLEDVFRDHYQPDRPIKVIGVFQDNQGQVLTARNINDKSPRRLNTAVPGYPGIVCPAEQLSEDMPAAISEEFADRTGIIVVNPLVICRRVRTPTSRRERPTIVVASREPRYKRTHNFQIYTYIPTGEYTGQGSRRQQREVITEIGTQILKGFEASQ